MASIYTHERFGRQLLADGVIAGLPEPFRPGTLSARWREAFLWGQQGPDPFFYHILLLPRGLRANPGIFIHRHSGYDYLLRGGQHVVTCSPDDPAWAYFLGTVCHFILDIHIHPFVDELETSSYRHMEIEGELDRHYMLADGLDPWDFALADLVPDEGAVAYMEPVYRPYGLTPKQLAATLRRMRGVRRLFHPASAAKEKSLLALLRLRSKEHLGPCHPPRPPCRGRPQQPCADRRLGTGAGGCAGPA